MMDPLRAGRARPVDGAAKERRGGDLRRETLSELLQEGEASGLSEQSWDEMIRELNVKHFGKEDI